VRDLINQKASTTNVNYGHCVTADDGALGEQHLRDFQDNEKSIPTILTTSQKLSTGVDAPEVRNIILLRPVNSMVEFKQIIGRGTRLFEGKDYFTVYDLVEAHHHFQDPEWDGPPQAPEPTESRPRKPIDGDGEFVDPNVVEEPRQRMIKVRLPPFRVVIDLSMQWHHIARCDPSQNGGFLVNLQVHMAACLDSSASNTLG
jgi:type I restriction enzyme R subunit